MLDDIDKLLGDDEPTGGGGAGPDAPLVVVIDDDAAVRRSLRFALDKKFRVDVYSSGPAGVDMMTEETSVVILDIKMPDRDGFGPIRRSESVTRICLSSLIRPSRTSKTHS